MNLDKTTYQNTMGSPPEEATPEVSDATNNLEESASNVLVGADALTAPESPSKKKKKKSSSSKSKGLDESTASLSVEKDLAAPESPKKSKKKSSSKSHISKSKLEESATTTLEASVPDDLTAPESPRKSKKTPKKKKDDKALPNDEEEVLDIVTEQMWASKDASSLEALHKLLEGDETRDYQKNRDVSVQMGAPLLVVRKMKDFPEDSVLQSTGLHLMRCWGNMPSPPWYQIVMAGGLARACAVLTAENTDTELKDNALSLLEQMASNGTAAKLLVNHNGVETLVHIVRGKNGTFIPRCLEALCNICELGGTSGRKKVTEHASAIVKDSEDSKLVSAVISVLSEMAKDEDTAKGLLQGKGVDALAHAFRVFEEERPNLSKKAFDLLLLLANDGGAASRQVVAESTVLETLVKSMTAQPKEEEVQKRGCQMVLALSVDQRKVIKDCGILALISQIFSIHRDDKVLKVAHDAMDAIVADKK